MWNERLVSVIRSLFLFFTSFYFFFKFYVLFASRLFFSPSLFKFDMTWMRQCIRFFWLRRPMSISRHIAVDRISSPQWYPSKNAIIGSIQKSLLFFFFFLLLYIISPKNKKWLFNFFSFLFLKNQTGTRTTSLLPLIERTAASAAIYVSSSSGLIVLEPWLQAIYRLWAS